MRGVWVAYPSMQKEQLSKATRTLYTILHQIATLIPHEFVRDAAEARNVKWRTFDTLIPDFPG